MQYYQIALKLLEVKPTTTGTYILVTESREHEVFEILSVPAENVIDAGYNIPNLIGFYNSLDVNEPGIYLEDCFMANFEFEHKENIFWNDLNIFWDNFTVLRNIGRKLPDKTLGVK